MDAKIMKKMLSTNKNRQPMGCLFLLVERRNRRKSSIPIY